MIDMKTINAIELFSRKFSLLTELLKQKARKKKLTVEDCENFRATLNKQLDETFATCLTEEEEIPPVW